MTHATTRLIDAIARAMVSDARTMHIRISPYLLELIMREMRLIDDKYFDLGGGRGTFYGIPYATTMAIRGFVLTATDAGGIPFSLEWNGEA